MSIQNVAIVSVPVSDQAKAKAFFRDRLGFEVIREAPMGPDQTWLQVGPKGAQTSLTLVTWFDAMRPGSVQGLVFETADVDRSRAELVERGVKISDVQSAPWGRFATFSDPDGNGYVLQERPK